MSFEKIVVEAMEKAVKYCSLSDGYKAIFEERIREYNERVEKTADKDSNQSV